MYATDLRRRQVTSRLDSAPKSILIPQHGDGERELKPVPLPMLYAASLFDASRLHSDLAALSSYCMFIGYPRSGHSLVGALIDAHPDAIIAHELDVLQLLETGARFSRSQIAALIEKNSRDFSVEGRTWTGYSYVVPNQWQGRFRRLRVLGDKKGGMSTSRLQRDPSLLDRLRAVMRVPLRVLHVVRNPYDNISTMALRAEARRPDAAIENYFGLVETVDQLRRRLSPDEYFEVRHEALLAEPAHHLTALCRFLDLVPSEDYLRDCASVLYPAPHASRDDLPWTAPAIEDVARRIARYDFLDGYTFDV